MKTKSDTLVYHRGRRANSDMHVRIWASLLLGGQVLQLQAIERPVAICTYLISSGQETQLTIRPVVEVESESVVDPSVLPRTRLPKLSSWQKHRMVSCPNSIDNTNGSVTIVVIGTTTEWESEAYDRDDLKLPGATDDLVRSVLHAVPHAVIVNQSGMPVEFPWLDQAPTLLQAFFGGNECGTAIANAIFGKSNPGGKLPITWPVTLDDYKHVEFGNAVTTVYTEGINVGYRWFDAPGRPKSAFPFGFGGSYTTFLFRYVL